jgi:hypothetical protein
LPKTKASIGFGKEAGKRWGYNVFEMDSTKVTHNPKSAFISKTENKLPRK